MSQLLDNTKKNDKNREKNREKLFLAQNFLKRQMSQLLEYTQKKMTRNREKRNLKIIFGSELSEANNEPIFRIHQKITKIEKNYFWLRVF